LLSWLRISYGWSERFKILGEAGTIEPGWLSFSIEVASQRMVMSDCTIGTIGNRRLYR